MDETIKDVSAQELFSLFNKVYSGVEMSNAEIILNCLSNDGIFLCKKNNNLLFSSFDADGEHLRTIELEDLINESCDLLYISYMEEKEKVFDITASTGEKINSLISALRKKEKYDRTFKLFQQTTIYQNLVANNVVPKKKIGL